MKAQRVLTAFALALSLAGWGCTQTGGGSSIPSLESSSRMEESGDWSAHLPSVYPGLLACLEANPSKPAYVGDVATQDDGTLAVHTVGADGSVFKCSVAANGGDPSANEPDDGAVLKGPYFYPENHVGPVSACTSTDKEPVFTTGKDLVGWLAWPSC
ncbi:MAG TPA: hypothetical protein VHA10_23160 [Hypericibacter adhaerens]|jgi:hypothetical protein|uniref:Lipoprotein n=1 Tax=Hypericibacter adhaerens TaxID=2602016 RepID=A0A5J6MT19_9PROT|nr:hypothetical protein [Hypericibacter adhaerens]QEX20489.1 hypothetical protein FRZ61_04060 [Hypericibacter adhaerens]HWA46134.1 hypothetical protein [Hypericibacter adhaerens]